MHNQTNNAQLLDSFQSMMQAHFDKLGQEHTSTKITISKLQQSQELTNQQLFNKLESTTKNLTQMIDNVATSKGSKTGKYVTRSTLAKSLMVQATKLTKTMTNTNTVMDTDDADKENHEIFFDEEVLFTPMESDSTLTTPANYHEAEAIVTEPHQ
jgi:hypothetical protein